MVTTGKPLGWNDRRAVCSSSMCQQHELVARSWLGALVCMCSNYQFASGCIGLRSGESGRGREREREREIVFNFMGTRGPMLGMGTSRTGSAREVNWFAAGYYKPAGKLAALMRSNPLVCPWDSHLEVSCRGLKRAKCVEKGAWYWSIDHTLTTPTLLLLKVRWPFVCGGLQCIYNTPAGLLLFLALRAL